MCRFIKFAFQKLISVYVRVLLGRHKRKPPRGMYLDHEDLVTFCGESEIESEGVLKGMDSEIVAIKRLVSFLYFML